MDCKGPLSRFHEFQKKVLDTDPIEEDDLEDLIPEEFKDGSSNLDGDTRIVERGTGLAGKGTDDRETKGSDYRGAMEAIPPRGGPV